MSLLAQYTLDGGGFAADWSWSTWILLAIGVVGFIVTAFRVDDRREGRRRRAIKGAAKLHEIGLDRAAAIAECYAVGDVTGAIQEARKLAAKARAAGGADEIAAKVVIKALPGLMADPVHGPRIREALAGGGEASPAAPSPTGPTPVVPQRL